MPLAGRLPEVITPLHLSFSKQSVALVSRILARSPHYRLFGRCSAAPLLVRFAQAFAQLRARAADKERMRQLNGTKNAPRRPADEH